HAGKLITLHAKRCGDTAATIEDIGGIVVRACAGVERGVDAGRHAAFAAEEAVLHTSENARAPGWRRAQNPAGGGRLGLERHITLNNAPISSAWVKRRTSRFRRSAWVGLARASASARNSM